MAAELGGAGDYGRLAAGGGGGEGILRYAGCERTVMKTAAGVWDPLELKFFVFG